MHTSDREIVKIILRRNSTITIFKRLNSLYVEKKYHSVYTAREELEAYTLVSNIVDDVAGIRVAEIISDDEVENTILLRYVDGYTFSEIFAADGLQNTLSEWSGTMLRLFVTAYKYHVNFDSDPGNFILSKDRSTLTVIDPVSRLDRLQYAPLVVFLFGLLKYRIRYIYRLNDFNEFWNTWRSLIESYSISVGGAAEGVYAELSEYSRMVAMWNCQYKKNEGVVMWIFRMVGISPIWRACSLWFSFLSSRKSADH